MLRVHIADEICCTGQILHVTWRFQVMWFNVKIKITTILQYGPRPQSGGATCLLTCQAPTSKKKKKIKIKIKINK